MIIGENPKKVPSLRYYSSLSGHSHPPDTDREPCFWNYFGVQENLRKHCGKPSSRSNQIRIAPWSRNCLFENNISTGNELNVVRELLFLLDWQLRIKCTDPETRLSLFKSLPQNVLASLNLSEASKVGANFLVPNHSMLACSVANIVKRFGNMYSIYFRFCYTSLFNHPVRTSTSQSLKGIVTSGAVKCGIYVAAKMVKRLK